MQQFMKAVITSLVCICVTGGTATTLAATKADASRPRFTSVTNLPDFDCSSENSSYTSQKCAAIVFEVQIVKIKQTDGVEVACVAYFPYSKLTVHTTKQGERVTLKWHLSTPGAAFSGSGIGIKEDYGDKIGDLIDTQTASSQDASLTFKNKIKRSKRFDHLPQTELDFGGGAVKACDGADPVISNSAD